MPAVVVCIGCAYTAGMSETTFPMTSHRPYLLRALVEWINDNDMTPHLLVDATLAGVQVPPSSVQDGRVILNISERAVARLYIDNQTVSFSARFGGVSHSVSVPVSAVLAVYARENGQGMALPDDIPGATSDPAPLHEEPATATAAPQLSAVPGSGAAPGEQEDGDEPPPPPEPGKRPFLRVVK
jgi:stringent starvation protein B